MVIGSQWRTSNLLQRRARVQAARFLLPGAPMEPNRLLVQPDSVASIFCHIQKKQQSRPH